MRKILKYVTCCLGIFTMMACSDLYETHEQYLKMGEETYVGRVDTLFADGGLNRIRIGWSLNADPKISTCEISWEGGSEPVVVPVDRSVEYMTKIIDLPEGKYIFSVKTKSESGKESLVQSISGEVYGTNYQSRLAQRVIKSIIDTPLGVQIKWESEEGCISTDLAYTNKDGVKKVKAIGADEYTTYIEDFVPESKFTVSSLFKPEANSLDNIRSLEKTLSFPTSPVYFTLSKTDWDATFHEFYEDVDRTGWTVEASTEEMTGEASAEKPHNGQAVSLLDGDLTTFWHSQWQGAGANPPLPHQITIDMKKMQNIMTVELVRRAASKDLKTAVFSISDDNENWTDAKIIGKLDFPNAENPSAQILALKEPVKGRYFRITVAASHNGVNASIAEVLFTSSRKK